MDFFEAVAKRGSYRDTFLPDPIPQCDLDRILTAAIQAPSGYNFQTTAFAVITDEQLRQQIAVLMPSKAVSTAPVIVVVLSRHVEQPANGLSFEIEDYAAATENLMLAVTALGYAGVWMDGAMKLENRAAKLRELLHVPQDLHLRTIVPIGRPVGAVTQKTKQSLSERVTYNRF